MPFDLKVIQSIKPPVVIFGTGYIREVGARKLSKPEVNSIIKLVKKAHLVGVRDFYTKNFLIKNGAKAGKIDLIGDPAVLLSEIKTNFRPKKTGSIGLNLNYSGWLGFGKWQDDILRAYQELGNYFQKKGFSIFYLSHHPGEKNIYPKLKIKGMKIVDVEARRQKYIYGQLNLVVGMMLHSCVMAFGAGTPEINVAYDIRNKNFAKFIGCPELFVRLEDLKKGELLRRAKMVLSQEEVYRKKFAAKKESIGKKNEYFLNNIIKLIK
jgi:polysaccharide pyruvyl transferase WcaK-like protein